MKVHIKYSCAREEPFVVISRWIVDQENPKLGYLSQMSEVAAVEMSHRKVTLRLRM